MIYNVTFLPSGKIVEVEAGKTILDAAIKANAFEMPNSQETGSGDAKIHIEAPCGGKGTCGKCKVRIINEEGEDQEVLACQTQVNSDLVIEVPRLDVDLKRKTDLTDPDLDMPLNAAFTKKVVQIDNPSLEDQTNDVDRLRRALGYDYKMSLEAIRSLGKILEYENDLVTVVINDDKIINVEKGDTSDVFYGLAIDIGTTSVVVSLVDMYKGKTIGIASVTNPQSVFGADVIARMEYAIENPLGLEKLSNRIIEGINVLMEKLAKENGIDKKEIYQMAVVGNTTMTHMFLGSDPRHLAASPFIPVFTESNLLEANDLGLGMNPNGQVYVLPNVAGYVGADTVGVILSTKFNEKKNVSLVLDIGTNGEMVLIADGRMVSCSTAAGPAFEGAHIEQGMRAATGAIEGIEIEEDIKLKIIGNVEARGICGSGLIDAISEMAKTGIIDETGGFVEGEAFEKLPLAIKNRIGYNDEGAYLILSAKNENGKEDIRITQKDVREMQLAKAAMLAGVNVMLAQLDITKDDLDEILLAGAFGSYIKPESALGLGILPKVDVDIIRSVGNAAGAGAMVALVSKDIRRTASRIAKEVEHMELSVRADFNDFFMDGMMFD